MHIVIRLLGVLILPLVVLSSPAREVKPMLAKQLQSFPAVRDLALSRDASEAYFTVQSHLGEIAVIMRIQRSGKRWKKPAIASFSGSWKDLEPFLSTDGLSLYFVSDRPLHPDSTRAKDFDIWVVTRENNQAPWSEPSNLGSPVNSEFNEFYPSLARSGNLYLTSDRPGTKGKDDIFISAVKEGVFQEPLPLSDSINTAGFEYNAFIAPDESYLLFSGFGRSDAWGSGDLYISYALGGSLWSKPHILGNDINSKQMDYCPLVVNGTLYFTSRRSYISTPEGGFRHVKRLLSTFQQVSNGQSRLYQVAFDPPQP